MVSSEQVVHDLTVALVSAKAKEHTAKEYVLLYNSLSEEVKKAYSEFRQSSQKVRILDRRELGL